MGQLRSIADTRPDRCRGLAGLALVALLTVCGCRSSAEPQSRAGKAPTAVSAPAVSAPAMTSALAVTSAPSNSQAAVAAPAAASSSATPQPELLRFISITTAGKQANEPLPWLVAMHGLGDRPESFARLFDHVSFAAHVYVPAAPLPYGDGFDWFGVRVSGDPNRLSQGMRAAAARVSQLIGELAKDGNNRGKPGVTGFSQGGMLSYTLAVLYPERIAFAAPVSGWLPPPLWPKALGPGRSVPIAAFHGEADRGVPYEQSRLAAEHLVGLGFPLTLQSYAGLGHAMSRELIADWDEVLATKLAAASVPSKSLAEAH